MKTKFLPLILLIVCLFSACGQKDITPTAVPFTEITWDNTLDQIYDLEGTVYEKSLSMAGGYNYIFAKKYLNFDGYIQYNIDDNDTLSGISWYYIGNDQNLAKEIYTTIQEHTSSILGRVEPIHSSNIHSGYKWETDDCTIFLISFAQNEEYAVQISYLLKSED